MLVDDQGKKQSTVVDKNLEEGWLLIEGCNFDPTLAESSDFELDVFKVTIDNVKNPEAEADTSPFSFEVFKSYNEGVLSQRIVYKDTFFLDSSTFFFPSGVIEEATLTSSGEKVGEKSDFQIKFKVGTILPEAEGFIELTTPVWGDGEYPMTDDISCESDQFETFETSIVDSILRLGYTKFLNAPKEIELPEEIIDGSQQ